MRQVPALVLVGHLLLAGVGRTAAGEQDTQTFRGGVDLVPVDVTVLDSKGRPVRGLQAADFEVLENGILRPIESFTEIEVAPALPDLDSQPVWSRDLGADVVSNARDVRRVVVIVMNDGSSGFSQGEPTSAKRIGRAIVDRLGPNDIAAVVFTFLGRIQNFTTNRADLLAAIDSFVPKNSASAGVPLGCVMKSCVITTLQTVAAALETAPAGRKLVMFVGSAFDLVVSDDLDSLTSDALSVRGRALRALQAANVTVNVFDPAGLATRATMADVRGQARSAIAIAQTNQAGLLTLAEATGGRAVINTNSPENWVSEVFALNRSYYLLGIRPSEPLDGRFRRLQVKAMREGATARTRAGYVAERRDHSGAQLRTALDQTLVRDAFENGVPIELSLLPLMGPERGRSSVLITARVAPEATGDPQAVDLAAVVFDSEWRERGYGRTHLPSEPRFATDRLPEARLQFDLEPGRYEIRVAAQSGARIGSVLANIDVPDFSKGELSATRLACAYERLDSQMIEVTDGSPILATTDRHFRRDDRVASWLRIYQGTKGPLMAVTVLARVADHDGRPVVERRSDLPSEAFRVGRQADFSFTLPLKELTAGSYLLTLQVTTGRHLLDRSLAFRIE